MDRKRVTVAMSGGVDSSVAAAVLMNDYIVSGATMHLFTDEDLKLDKNKSCCSDESIADAKAVAEKLNIEHTVFEFGSDFKRLVIEPFNNAYINGFTPNPCVLCNCGLKFDLLLEKAIAAGSDLIATGHYVQSGFDEKTGRWYIEKGADPKKDQSYVLYGLSQYQLSHTIFPLGNMTKSQVRQIAEEYGFVNAQKSESQDICFIPDGNYADFIENYTGRRFPDGDFIDKNGNKLGTHRGIIRYTTGQRRGLDIALGERAFVIDKDIVNNTVTLGKNEDLFSYEAVADNVNWVSIEKPQEPIEVCARVRYNMAEQPAILYPIEDDKIKVVFKEKQRAITLGQAVVCYSGNRLLCGGRCCKK